MMIGRISGATRVLGKSQCFLGLPIRDEMIEVAQWPGATPCMVTAWEPTPDELERLNRGAVIHVRIIGVEHPPIMVDVGEVVE